MKSTLQSRMKIFAPFLLVVVSMAAITLSCLRALNFPFVSDDKAYITSNSALAGLPWTELWRLFVQPYNPWEFLPLRDFSYWLDMAWFGSDPSVFRIHNLILYAICCLLVFVTTQAFWKYFRPSETSSATWVAAIATCLFTVHPAHIEAIVWISARKDVLSGMFAMLALYFAINAKRENGFATRYAIATLFALLAAILSKATSVAAAPVIAILWLIFWRDIPPASRRLVSLLWPLAIMIAAAGFTLIFSANSSVKYPAYFGIEAVTRSLAILGWLARLAISPESRHFIYSVLDSWFAGMVALGIMVFVSAITATVILIRKRSLEWYLLIIFALLCIPYLQLIPFSTDSLVYDRYLFLSVWPVVLLITALSWRLHPLSRVALLSVLLALFSYQSFDRPKYWASNETLFERDFIAWPENYSLAFDQIIERQLPYTLFREARETASHIAVPEVRNIMDKYIDVASAMLDAGRTGDPREAVAQLNSLAVLVEQPAPARAKWDPPLSAFWVKCKISYVYAWKNLMAAFPDDELVRKNYRTAIMKYAGH